MAITRAAPTSPTPILWTPGISRGPNPFSRALVCLHNPSKRYIPALLQRKVSFLVFLGHQSTSPALRKVPGRFQRNFSAAWRLIIPKNLVSRVITDVTQALTEVRLVDRVFASGISSGAA